MTAGDRYFLVGLPGSGKTTMGGLLAEEIGYPFFDLDREIEKENSKKISNIFADNGEDFFRELESDALSKMINQHQRAVISTGGGTPCFHENMALMNKSGITIFLDVPPDQIRQRIKKDTSRPLMRLYSPEELYERRIKDYLKAQIKVSGLEELLLKIKPEG